jgi:LmbE family N-acetylglucosaminyl deacetylase
MKLSHPEADIFVPDGSALETALARTTHLAIGAHPDDLEIFSYSGIADCYGRTDRWYSGVVVTDGGGSSRTGPYQDLSDEAMKVQRRDEQRQAAVIGAYSVQIQLAHPSVRVKDRTVTEVVDDLEVVLRATRPEVLYLHNPADKHDTHVAVLGRCLSALRRLPLNERPRQVYGCEVWRDLDWMIDADKQALDAGGHPEVAAALLKVFDSQISGGKRYDMAALGRRLAHATFFESHATDKSQALIWAMDLTPLVRDDALSLAEFTRAFIDRFARDVAGRLDRYAGG